MTAVRRRIIAAVGALALVAALPTPIESARWWRSPRFITRLKLTPSQQSAIQRVYDETLGERMARARDARAARDRLNGLLASDASYALLEAAASQMAEADAARSRQRTMMLYQMSRVLTAAQRARFATLANTRHRSLRDSVR